MKRTAGIRSATCHATCDRGGLGAVILCGALLLCGPGDMITPVQAELQIGTAITDVTPVHLPVLVNGGMLSRSVDKVNTPLSARAIVLDDGKLRLAIVVVDSCMMPRTLLDEAKQVAATRTTIAPERMLISATHTHTAGSCMGALGTDADPNYVPYLREKLAQSIATAEANLQPCQVGFGTIDAAEFNALRRWIRRTDRRVTDPFGNPTVQANMHAARNWNDVTGPSGPEDPELSLLSFQDLDGNPLAVLANFSMHYFGDRDISADYYGLFCNAMQDRLRIEQENSESPTAPVVLMSHGCSGDVWRRNYFVPEEQQPTWTIQQYSQQLVDRAMQAYGQVQYKRDADLAMAEHRQTLRYRTPSAERLQWAEQILKPLDGGLPTNQVEVYAREQVLLHQLQQTEIVVQALRIGDVAIATTPNETYALTGLKLKLQSPLPQTMVIELANGGDGYIPPPEQHFLGGYNTWPARSAGLEIEAEPKIVATAIGLLEQVCNEPRRIFAVPLSPQERRILEQEPQAFWRLNDFSGPVAEDASAHRRDAIYELGITFFLLGAEVPPGTSTAASNRSTHFAGGRLIAQIPELENRFSVVLWLWNGMPSDDRDHTGWFYSRDHASSLSVTGEHLGIGGNATLPGRLVFQHGGPADTSRTLVGKTELKRWHWHRILLQRAGKRVTIYVDDNKLPEIDAELAGEGAANINHLFFGGRSDQQSPFEGRLDNIAVFDRVITPEDLEVSSDP